MGSGYGLPPLQDKAVSLRILGQKKTHVGISEACSHGDCTANLVVKWDRNLREFPWFNSTYVSFAGVESLSILFLELFMWFAKKLFAFCIHFLEFIDLYLFYIEF